MNNEPQIGPARSSLLTIIAVAIVAYASSDAVHELVGHGSVALLSGIKVTSVSSVGLQSLESNRLLSAGGCIANGLAGLISFVLLRRRTKFDPAAYFLWLFGFVNLMNGTGYLLASALLNSGDWSVVIAGQNPSWAWRMGMGIVGLVLYLAVVRWAAALLTALVECSNIDIRELSRLTVPAYLAGGLLMILAAVFNPFSPSLILLSGAGASLGLTWGLLLIPGMVKARQTSDPQFLPLNWVWVGVGAAVAIVFIGVFGRGFRFA